MATPTELRIETLTNLLIKLCGALERKGTQQDGKWGFPSFEEEVAQIKKALEKERGR